MSESSGEATTVYPARRGPISGKCPVTKGHALSVAEQLLRQRRRRCHSGNEETASSNGRFRGAACMPEWRLRPGGQPGGWGERGLTRRTAANPAEPNLHAPRQAFPAHAACPVALRLALVAAAADARRSIRRNCWAAPLLRPEHFVHPTRPAAHAIGPTPRGPLGRASRSE